MIIPENIPVYGDINYRSNICPKETAEQCTFIARVRAAYPESIGKIIFHARNEGLLINRQFSGINKHKAMGMVTGCPDIHIPGNPSMCMEIKRRDRTLSQISDEQIEYLLTAKNNGAFTCIALGCDAAMEAFNEWIKQNG